ncbi:MAG: hydantoinase B/oxoprolinase family protein [Pseudomonadota bacterium]
MTTTANPASGQLNSLDPITLALFQNRLDYIAKQMGWVMTRTARSPIFNQSHDFSCFLADGNGRLVSQADGIPIHTGGGGFAVRAVLAAFGDDISPGDVFILSDPYEAGGNHLPDWVIARPVFVDGERVAFACNRAHQSDIGGGAAGTYNSSATDIFQEGIRLPAMRLIERDQLRDDLWQLLLLNSRTPHYLDGDLRAMIGSTRMGAEMIAERVGSLGLEAGAAYMDGIMDHADVRFRQAVSALPDGTYHGEDGFDDDCFEPMDIPIKVSITVKGDRMTVDWTGSGPQIKGFKNSSLANTFSAVYTALSSFFDADMPRNEGTFRCVDIIAPKGTIVNSNPPAPVTMCTVFPSHQMIQACWRALAQMDSERACAGWGPNAYPTSAGTDEHGRTYVVYHWGGNSGAGAVNGRDGFNQIGPMITFGGLVLPNAEMQEQLFPVRVIRQEFRLDGGGAGQYRGGTGVEYEVEHFDAAHYSFRAEGVREERGYGVNGGANGKRATVGIADTREQDATPSDYGPTPTYGVHAYPPGRLKVVSSGGGGWGNPYDRDARLVARDVQDGLVSVDDARDLYGVELTPKLAVDETQTATRRTRMSQAAHKSN